MKINELVIEAVKQRLDPKCWTGKHKEGTKIKGGVRVNNCVPNESIEESKVTPSAKDLKLADALEDYANKNISEREPGFGDFMYHAELIRKGHKDIHKQDLKTVQQKYRKTINDMIKQHLDETLISEGLTYMDPVSKWIAVFKASKHPKFDGKTAEQREKMARMAQYKAVQNKKPLSEAASKENIYDILEPENCGPFDGGCILVAQALKEIHGGDIVVLINDRGNADHAVVKIGNRLIDYDGSLPVEQFIKRFEKNEHVKVKGIRPLESGDLPDASRNQSLLPKIVDLLSRKRSKTLSESKKRKAKTLIDGMIKSLIKQGRTHDEAVSDLKRQVDARFYEHIDAIAAMITEQESNADSANEQQGR